MINDNDLKKYIITGASLDKDLKPITYKSGYMVSKMGMERTHQPEELEKIKADILTYKQLLKNNEYVGLWFFEGKIYIDISKHYTKKDKAILAGIKNKQYSIFDLRKGDEIQLTKKTYILYKYNKIKNDIRYIKEYTDTKEMTHDLQMNYNTLRQYIIDSIDKPIKALLNDKYIIVSNEVYYRELEEI